MRRDIGGHTHRNTRGTIDQQIWESGRKNGWFFFTFIIVRLKIDRIAVNIIQQKCGSFGQPSFGITHGGGAITIHRAKVTLPVNQLDPHGPRLSHTHHGIVNRGVTMRMVFTHHLTNCAGRFAVRFIVGKTAFMHGIQDATMNRLKTISHIRQRTADNNRHRIREVGGAHLLLNGYGQKV